jgi:hypothetical protein
MLHFEGKTATSVLISMLCIASLTLSLSSFSALFAVCHHSVHYLQSVIIQCIICNLSSFSALFAISHHSVHYLQSVIIQCITCSLSSFSALLAVCHHSVHYAHNTARELQKNFVTTNLRKYIEDLDVIKNNLFIKTKETKYVFSKCGGYRRDNQVLICV